MQELLPEGAIWIDVDGTSYGPVVKYDASNGDEILKFGSFLMPIMNIFEKDSSLWIADGNKLFKYSSEGVELISKDLPSTITDIGVDNSTGNCWISLEEYGIQKLSESDGSLLDEYRGIDGIARISINPEDGSCWVADEEGRKVIKLSSNCEVVVENIDFTRPVDVEVDPRDGACWVNDKGEEEIVKLSSDGDEIFNIEHIKMDLVCVNPNTGYCYATGDGLLLRIEEGGYVDICWIINPQVISSLDVNTYRNTVWVSYEGFEGITEYSEELRCISGIDVEGILKDARLVVDCG